MPSPYRPVAKNYRPGESLLTVQEVADELRVSKMTAYRLIHAGELTAMRVGRSFRVPERALDEYVRLAFQDHWGPER